MKDIWKKKRVLIKYQRSTHSILIIWENSLICEVNDNNYLFSILICEVNDNNYLFSILMWMTWIYEDVSSFIIKLEESYLYNRHWWKRYGSRRWPKLKRFLWEHVYVGLCEYAESRLERWLDTDSDVNVILREGFWYIK
jgi:hypothetical protein